MEKNDQTILLITHDIEEALSLGTKVAVMTKNPGTIQSVFSVPYSERILADKDYHIEEDNEFMKKNMKFLRQYLKKTFVVFFYMKTMKVFLYKN
ncbi:hypothetical protein LZ578_04455 [Jeotgalibaca sp. MA1X17-3]|uniref:hypothetical protein n=1 Tax=Jeotgalibaca sp. MA1X17-3 TaxID=2908211 RepID=UPI001F23B087|nr:hypothetical protein [Jeotgalibaca sp. MA1X17-3]UJF16377.1 hypothetical protein LZ578_04455 [Jeotgalibaca sp. MA1X17-3]